MPSPSVFGSSSAVDSVETAVVTVLAGAYLLVTDPKQVIDLLRGREAEKPREEKRDV